MADSRLPPDGEFDGETFRLFLDAAVEMMFALDADGAIVGASRAVARTLGFEPTEVRGRRLAALVHPEDRDVVVDAVRTLQQGPGRLAIPETRWLHRDGTLRRVEGVGVSARGEGEGSVRVVIGATDVTASRALLSDLIEARKARALGSIAVGVAHDLNNLVTAISGYSELTLGLIPEDGPVRRHVAEVARAADRAASLTRQLLAFGRRRVLQPHPLDVGEVVDHIEDLLRRMLGEDIELRLQHDAKPALVFGDPAEIEQLIADAAISAREDLPRGGAFAITLRHAELDRPSPEEGLPAGSYVELRMEKVGPGRPTAEVDERWCASSIALARELARRRGGTARIGSTEADREGIAILLPSLSPSREPAGRDGQGPRGWETLLLVEDEADVRGLVREMLTSLGYDVVEAAGAQEALSVAEAHHGPIHLLLTDVVMPGMGGPELARRLTAVRPDIRVLMMSGYPDARLDEKDGLLGPTLRKPFSRRMLAVRVRDLIDGR